MRYFVNHDEITNIVSFQVVFDVKMIDKNGFDSKYPLTKEDNPAILKWFETKNENKFNELNIFNFKINGLISSCDRFLMRFDMDFKDYDMVYFSKLISILLDTEDDYFLRKEEYVTIKGYKN
jgi:hypothetical protein